MLRGRCLDGWCGDGVERHVFARPLDWPHNGDVKGPALGCTRHWVQAGAGGVRLSGAGPGVAGLGLTGAGVAGPGGAEHGTALSGMRGSESWPGHDRWRCRAQRG